MSLNLEPINELHRQIQAFLKRDNMIKPNETMEKDRLSRELRFSTVMMNDTPFMEGFVKQEIEREFTKGGHKVSLWYYTFRDDGWRCNWVSLQAFSWYDPAERHEILVTALEAELSEAIQWVKDNNPHLKFFEIVREGYNNNDFAYLRKSAVLRFELIA